MFAVRASAYRLPVMYMLSHADAGVYSKYGTTVPLCPPGIICKRLQITADMVGCPFGRRYGRCRTRKVDLRGVLFFRTSWGRPDLRKRVRSRATTLATIRICSCLRPRLESPTRKRCGLGRCCLRRSPGHPGRRDIHPGCRRPCEQHLRPTRVRCRRLVGSVTRLPFRLG